MHKLSALGNNLTPEGDQLLGGITRDAVGPYWVVDLVIKLGDSRQTCHSTENIVEIIPVCIGRVRLKVQHLSVRRPTPPFTRTRNQRFVDQSVVLHETHEYAAQDPGNRRLRQNSFAPDLEGLPRTTCFFSGPILRLQAIRHFGHTARALPKIGLQVLNNRFRSSRRRLGSIIAPSSSAPVIRIQVIVI